MIRIDGPAYSFLQSPSRLGHPQQDATEKAMKQSVEAGRVEAQKGADW